MFSWFLKLLGINEDRPSASESSYLNSNASNTSNTKSTASPAVEETPAETISTGSKKETKTAVETAVEVEAEAEPKSLADEFPNLKANYIKVLEEGGFTTKATIDQGSDKDLLALKGIGKATVKMLRS